MKKMDKNRRYIYDPLYGPIYLPDFIWSIIPCPELQRLREVRLCNINSFCLTGGANINRYEHSIGTCYLAQECLNFWPLLNPVDEKEQELFLLAALLHDVSSAVFGHSLQYIESRYGFEHEAFKYAVTGAEGASYSYKSTTLEPIFFGMGRELSSKISSEDIDEIDKIVKGEGRFGPLINSTMDLDNIDNVFRLGYHIGLVKSGEVPLKLARSLYIENNKLIVRKEAVPLVEEGYKARKRLYQLLLLNPEEFSAKCMLTEAIEIAKAKKEYPFRWYYVDYEFLKKLSDISSELSIIISRLLKGDLYGCIGIFSTMKIDKDEIFSDVKKRTKLEDELNSILRAKLSSRFKSAMVALHLIIDVNKTERQVCIQTDDGISVKIGRSSKQLLIGVFFKNQDLNIYKINKIPSNTMYKIQREVYSYLSDILEEPNLRKVELYGEINECK